MNYQQTIDYLFTRLPMFSRIGAAAYKADLTNTIALCNALGNPQHQFRTIHIAGTNGKGSVSHMLAAIFQTAGYKTGLYTSPHLRDFRERIKIDGEMISENFVVEFTENIQDVIEPIEPSFFEITVGMAFDYFAKQKVDIAIIETGLGGRLDSTNIIYPELSIITHIGMDHMNLLGDTLEKIATEKAGIIKPNVPVVMGEIPEAVHQVFETAAANASAPIFFASQLREVMDWHWEHDRLTLAVATNGKTDHNHYVLDLPGLYQTKNILTVLEACHQLIGKGWKLTQQHITSALSSVKKLTGLHGRWETIHRNPSVIIDVAHNEDGMKQLVQQVEVTDHHHLHIIIGMVNDKAIENVLALLPKTATYYFTQASIPRALPAADLARVATTFQLEGKTYTDVNSAIKTAIAHAREDDLIVVCGSVFLIGEIQGRHGEMKVNS